MAQIGEGFSNFVIRAEIQYFGFCFTLRSCFCLWSQALFPPKALVEGATDQCNLHVVCNTSILSEYMEILEQYVL